ARALAVDAGARWPSVDALVTTLERTPRRRRRIAIAAGAGAGLAVAAVVAVIVLRPGPDRCAAAGAQIDSVWSPARSRAVHAGITAVDPSHGEARWNAVTDQLDHQAEEWHAQATAACRAGAKVADDLRSRQQGCLERRRTALGAAVAELADARSPADVDRAVVAVARLAPVDACAAGPANDPEVQAPGEADRAEAARAMADDHPDQAEAPLHRAIDATVDAYGPDHPETARAWHALGLAYEAQGKWADALPAFQNAATIRAQRTGDTPELAETLVAMAPAQQSNGKHEDALASLEHAVRILRTGGPSARHDLARALIADAQALASFNRLDDARARFDEAIATYEAMGDHDPDRGITIVYRGELASHHGDCAGALADFQHALDVITEDLGPDHPYHLYALADLGRCLVELGRAAEAIPVLDKAVAIHPGGGLENVLAVQAQFDRGRALYESGKDKAAGLAAARAARRDMDTVPGAASLAPDADLWLARHPR
ncbi:MAG TPA: tetratricopeptide repeat protein, partial [Kofleriaceae bacterium]|nr:tetratricopeptide repeat protein [Kofleriaceae bacterium]